MEVNVVYSPPNWVDEDLVLSNTAVDGLLRSGGLTSERNACNPPGNLRDQLSVFASEANPRLINEVPSLAIQDSRLSIAVIVRMCSVSRSGRMSRNHKILDQHSGSGQRYEELNVRSHPQTEFYISDHIRSIGFNRINT